MVNMTDRRKAGALRNALNQNGTGTTVTGIATNFCPNKPQLLTQNIT